MFKKSLFLLFVLAILLGLKEEERNPKEVELLKYRIEYSIADKNERIEIENAVRDKFKDLDIELIRDRDLKDFLFNCRKER